VSPQYVDAGLLVQIVKAVMEGMAGSATQTTPSMQIPQAAPMTSMTMDNVVPLVRLVKSMWHPNGWPGQTNDSLRLVASEWMAGTND
jgi:hypothetical protein